MNKEQMNNFCKEYSEKNKVLTDLLDEKIAEFMQYQDELNLRLSNLLKELFPPEIKSICKEYTDVHCAPLRVGALAIDFKLSGGHPRITFNVPNRYTTIVYSLIDEPHYIPESVNDLERCSIILDHYKLMADELEKTIPEMYDIVSKWKENYYNEQLAFLNNLTFHDVPEKHYKVTISIEEI